MEWFFTRRAGPPTTSWQERHGRLNTPRNIHSARHMHQPVVIHLSSVTNLVRTYTDHDLDCCGWLRVPDTAKSVTSHAPSDNEAVIEIIRKKQKSDDETRFSNPQSGS